MQSGSDVKNETVSDEITVAEAVAIVGVNRQRISQYVADGRIRVLRWVSKIRILSRADAIAVRDGDRSPGPKKKGEVSAPAPKKGKGK
jgi:hypothetical protein